MRGAGRACAFFVSVALLGMLSERAFAGDDDDAAEPKAAFSLGSDGDAGAAAGPGRSVLDPPEHDVTEAAKTIARTGRAQSRLLIIRFYRKRKLNTLTVSGNVTPRSVARRRRGIGMEACGRAKS